MGFFKFHLEPLWPLYLVEHSHITVALKIIQYHIDQIQLAAKLKAKYPNLNSIFYWVLDFVGLLSFFSFLFDFIRLFFLIIIFMCVYVCVLDC